MRFSRVPELVQQPLASQLVTTVGGWIGGKAGRAGCGVGVRPIGGKAPTGGTEIGGTPASGGGR
ncbi:hypothetical protein BH09PSE5_BH09PSE5_07550 [soil metagenome]